MREEIKPRAGGQRRHERLIVMRRHAIGRRFDNRRERIRAAQDKGAREDRLRSVACREGRDFNRPIDPRARRDAQHDAILHKCGVQGDQRIVAAKASRRKGRRILAGEQRAKRDDLDAGRRVPEI